MSGPSLVEQVWSGRRPWLSALLRPLGWAWGAGAFVHRGLYDTGLLPRERVDVPVISIGNLVVGGSGKTPAALELAKRLLARGRKVAVLSRGYGREVVSPTPVIVSDGETVRATVAEAGDEPYLLAVRCPGLRVVVAPRRIDAARVALELGADLLLLDDGFSHHALARDADVLVVDASAGHGNGLMLPAGPLREAESTGRGASLVWLSRCPDERAMPPAALSERPLVRTRAVDVGFLDLALRPAFGLEHVRGRRIVGFAGIARPSSFEAKLRELGANLRHFVPFPDHHRFTAADVERLSNELRRDGAELLVTTEKDAVRLAPLVKPDFAVALRQDTEVLGDASLLDLFVDRFAPGTRGRP